ncbi:hypothetical protein CO046_02325 [Candidatus Peregrinibacteria bacterium CG_4_9_14_0_2_um_filter_53_11]|nr:MAG: hypothetical protein CO046_02325 [Candidatus Peregrinibacteria bacterium CG_4_9_14_0_2_um_filter_53_11]
MSEKMSSSSRKNSSLIAIFVLIAIILAAVFFLRGAPTVTSDGDAILYRDAAAGYQLTAPQECAAIYEVRQEDLASEGAEAEKWLNVYLPKAQEWEGALIGYRLMSSEEFVARASDEKPPLLTLELPNQMVLTRSYLERFPSSADHPAICGIQAELIK